MRKQLNKEFYHRLKKQQLLDILRDEVLQNEDFIRHVQETAEKENVTYEIAFNAVSDFITQTALESLKVAKIKKRITYFGFFNIEILKNTYNPLSFKFIKRD